MRGMELDILGRGGRQGGRENGVKGVERVRMC